MSRFYIVYSYRAFNNSGTDDASVLSSTSSLKEAIKDAEEQGHGAIYSYKDNNGELTDERWEQDIGNEGDHAFLAQLHADPESMGYEVMTLDEFMDEDDLD